MQKPITWIKFAPPNIPISDMKIIINGNRPEATVKMVWIDSEVADYAEKKGVVRFRRPRGEAEGPTVVAQSLACHKDVKTWEVVDALFVASRFEIGALAAVRFCGDELDTAPTRTKGVHMPSAVAPDNHIDLLLRYDHTRHGYVLDTSGRYRNLVSFASPPTSLALTDVTGTHGMSVGVWYIIFVSAD